MSNNPSFFKYGGQNIAFYKVGAGKPLIILHGWGSSSDVMLPIAESLSDVRESHLIDLPGFGRSEDPPTPWEIRDYADMVLAFTDEKFPNQKVDLLVHSFGARVVLKILSDSAVSNKFDNILITGGAGLKPKRSPSYYFKKYTAKTLKLPFLFLPKPQREKGLSKLRETSLWKSLGSSDYQKLTGVMRHTFVKSVTEYFDSTLPSINHNVLLLWGEDDGATPIDQAKRMEKGLKNGALVTIENAGHYAFLDQPARFSAIARAFFE